MEESYGVGYATRAADMGYGQVYGEAVKAILDKKSDKMEMQKGASAERRCLFVFSFLPLSLSHAHCLLF